MMPHPCLSGSDRLVILQEENSAGGHRLEQLKKTTWLPDNAFGSRKDIRATENEKAQRADWACDEAKTLSKVANGNGDQQVAKGDKESLPIAARLHHYGDSQHEQRGTCNLARHT